MNLTGKTISSMSWMLSSTAAKALAQLGFLAIMARLLTPMEFGTMGVVIIISSVSTIFIQLGVGSALIQKQTLSDEHIQSAYYFCIALGLLISASVFTLSQNLADLFNIPELELIIKYIIITYISRGFSLVAEALVIRSMNFKLLATREFFAYIIGYGIIGCTMAYFDYGIWALVSAYITSEGIRAGILIISMPHTKTPQIKLSALGELLKFGGGTSIAAISNMLARNMDRIIVARLLDVGALGIYERAQQIVLMPSNFVNSIMTKVLFPAYSQIQDNKEQFASIHKRGMSLIALVFIPLSIFMYQLSTEITITILGDKWTSVIPVFEILVVGVYFRVVNKINTTIAKAVGKVYKLASVQMTFVVTITTGSLIGHHFGLHGVAIGVVTAFIIHYILMTALGLKFTGLSLHTFVVAHIPGIILGVSIFILLDIICNLPALQQSQPVYVIILSAIASIIISSCYLFVLRYFDAGEPVCWLIDSIKKGPKK